MSTRDFDEHSITDAVVERFAATPDARLKQILTIARAARPRFRPRRRADAGRVVRRGDVPDPRRAHERRQAAGVHPPVRHARHLDAGRCDQPPAAGGRDRDDGARAVLRAGPAGDGAWRGYLGRAQGLAALCQRQRHRARRHAAGRRVRRCVAGGRRRVLRRAEGRATIRSCARGSSPMRRGGSRSGRWCRTFIRSPTTARSATC